ncbi:MAG: tetratricopeptide repeat protein [Myxococcota bacterium]
MRKLCPVLLLTLLSVQDAYADDERDSLPPAASDTTFGAAADPDDDQRQIQAEVQRLRGRSITRIKSLISTMEAGPQRAELVLRLAELYFDESRYQRFYGDPSDADRWLVSAVRLYQHILETTPTYPRAGEAAYFLASAYEELQQVDEALDAWITLTRVYPDNPLLARAYVQIGEHYFDRGQVFKALLAYQAALKAPDAEIHDYARYRAAWCYYNLGEYEQARETMAAVAMRAGDRLSLQDEARRDFVRFAGETLPVDQALAALNRLQLPADERLRFIGVMADIKLSIGEDQQAIALWGRMLQLSPAPEPHLSIVAAHLKAGRYSQALDALQRMEASEMDAEARVAAAPLMEKTLREIAVRTHLQARKTRNAELYAIAEAAYAAWLARFSEDPQATELRYAYGELLYEKHDHLGAYEQYTAALEADPRGARAKFCAEGAVFAAERLVAAEGDTDEFTAHEQRLLTALDRYTAAFPSGDRATRSLYQSAYLLYNHDRFAQASERFSQVIQREPGSANAEKAANLILDALVLTEEWGALKSLALSFRDMETLGGPSFRDEMQVLYERAAFKEIEVNASSAPVEAAIAWSGFAAAHPDSLLAAQALNNAAVMFSEHGLRADAIETRRALLERYPASPYVPDQLAALGFALEAIADFEGAARQYEALVAVDPAHQAAADALYSAALFRRALGQPEAALANFEQFVNAFPEDRRHVGVILEAAELLVASERWAEAEARYRRFADDPPEDATRAQRLYARLSQGRVCAAAGRDRTATAAWNILLTEANEMGVTTDPSLAEALYHLASRDLVAFKTLSLDASGRAAARRQLEDIGQAYHALEARYSAVIDAGALEWAFAAWLDVGAANEHIAASLASAPMPRGLTESQRLTYSDLLQDRIRLLEDKAASYYALVMKQSADAQFYDARTAAALGNLQRLRPGEYPGLSEDLLNKVFTSGGGAQGMGYLEAPE